MQSYVVYLFYLSLILLLGIIVTALSNMIGMSNALLLIISGYVLKLLGFNYFDNTLIILLSSITLVLIVLETATKLDLKDILKNFVAVLRFSLQYFFLCLYIMTLIIYQWFNIPGDGFDAFTLSLLLSIIIYGSDPSIAMEFLKAKKSRIAKMLEIEGIISGLIVVAFSIYIIGQFGAQPSSVASELLSQMEVLKNQIFIAVAVGIAAALIVSLLLKNLRMNNELKYLFVVAFALLCFAFGESIKTNGGFAVAIFGLALKGMAKDMPVKRNSIFSHAFYIFVFILLGINFSFPSAELWIKGALLFVFYLILRFFSTILFLPKLSFKEKTFFTLNVAKGIEVAIVLFIMQTSLGHLDGIATVVSLGYMFFVMSYVVAFAANRISKIYI